MNYCTVSYTCCLLGLGTLATRNRFHGYEFYQYAFGNSRIGSSVWYNTLLKHRFTDEEARRFLAGPGHAAWQWMQKSAKLWRSAA